MNDLQVVEQRIRSCRDCVLWANRSKAVPGEGPIDADIFIIGEAPGKTEDTHGYPFRGVSGNRLKRMLGDAGISIKDCYLTNMVKCWPGQGNPDPMPEEILACDPWLQMQLDLIRPKGILTFGRHSTQRFLEFPPKSGITKMMGAALKDWWPDGSSYYVMPMLHPAARNIDEYYDTVVQYLRNFNEMVYNDGILQATNN